MGASTLTTLAAVVIGHVAELWLGSHFAPPPVPGVCEYSCPEVEELVTLVNSSLAKDSCPGSSWGFDFLLGLALLEALVLAAVCYRARATRAHVNYDAAEGGAGAAAELGGRRRRRGGGVVL